VFVKAVRVKLRTNNTTAAALADTMSRFNAACNAYHQTRTEFGLPSQLTVRAIAKVCDTYKTDRSQCHTFGPRGAVVFDARCFKMQGVSSASLTTTQGRHSFSLAHGGKQREQLSQGTTGEADLLFADGNYYLSIAVKFPDPPKADTSGGILGVDMGIVELATDSEGQSFSGEALTNIRDRASGFNKTMRWQMGNWAFADLAAKVVYKAGEVGLPVVFVDPRNTSRTCSVCGHCDKANRKRQASFQCLSCGFCANADKNASKNIEARAELSERLMFRSNPALLA